MINAFDSLGERVDRVVSTLRHEADFSKRFIREYPADCAGMQDVIDICARQATEFRQKIEALIEEYQI